MDSIIKYSRIPLAIAFFVALLDLPYGYYELLRTVGMVLFIAYGIYNYKNKKEDWSYFWFGSAVLINPIFKIALGAVLWKVVDVIWGVVLLYKYNED